MEIATYTEKYNFGEVGVGYINGIFSNNSDTEFSVNFKYGKNRDDEFVLNVVNGSDNIDVARAGLEGFAKGLMLSSNRMYVSLNENNWLEYFLESPLFPRPSQEELRDRAV